jgi:hypothetical protein
MTITCGQHGSGPHDWLTRRFVDFWTAPASPRPLAWFRIGLSGVLLVQALSVLGHLEALHGRDGIVAWSVPNERPAGLPHPAWVERALELAGIQATFVVPFTHAAYVVGLVGLLLGCRARMSAAVAWLAHSALLSSGELSMYGVDRYAQIGLFYCVCFPVGHAIARDATEGRVSGGPSVEARLGVRVLQAHICIAYVASGIEKGLGEQWWNGEAVWRAVMSYEAWLDGVFLAEIPWLAEMLGLMTLLLEAGCILLVWHPITRKLWLTGIVAMHLGIALAMGLWVFSATMIVFDIAVFGVGFFRGSFSTSLREYRRATRRSYARLQTFIAYRS